MTTQHGGLAGLLEEWRKNAAEQDDPSCSVCADELQPFLGRLKGLEQAYRKLALDSREESDRIRRTVIVATDAESNCLVRAELWDKFADELHALIHGQSPIQKEGRET